MAKKRSMLDVQVKKCGKGVVYLSLRGSLDAHTAPRLEERLNSLFNSKTYKIIVNLEEVDYIASAGAGVFLGSVQEARSNEGDILLVKPSVAVDELFTLLGVNGFFKFFDNLSDAMAHFGAA